jgi:hypothetical protein
MSEVKQYLTKEGEVFETLVELGGANPKDYDLTLLQAAEARVIKGTNKTLQTALNSLSGFKNFKNDGVKVKDAKDAEFDEYGLSDSFYTQQQMNYIRSSIDKYRNGYDIATPYQETGVIQLAKFEWTITELGTKIAQNPKKDDIASLKMIQELHAKLSNDLKLTTRQSVGDANSEDMFTNACIDYEKRFRGEYFAFEEVEDRDAMQEVMIKYADRIVDFMKESSTYFHFRKKIADELDVKPKELKQIGLFTIEEFYDFLQINADRKMIQDKNDLTFDDNFKDKGDSDGN